MAALALEALRRLQRARSAQDKRSRAVVNCRPLPATSTREAFLESIAAAQGRVGAVYPGDLLGGLTEEETQTVLKLEKRVDGALQAGDFAVAQWWLEEWERAWLETIKASNVHQGRNRNVCEP